MQGELIHERFVEVLGDGIFNVDGEKWIRQRKVAILEFSSSSTHAYRNQALKLMNVLLTSVKDNRIVDMQVGKMLTLTHLT